MDTMINAVTGEILPKPLIRLGDLPGTGKRLKRKSCRLYFIKLSSLEAVPDTLACDC
jgi:hypothetical protein